MAEIRITDLNVEEVMTHEIGVVKHNTPISQAIDIILSNDWEEVLVINEHDKFTDIITKKKLLQMIKIGIDQSQPIKNVCRHEVVTTTPDTPLIEARGVMREKRIGRLPVIDDHQQLVGILTARDVCNGFSSKLEMLGEHMYSIMENISEAIQVIDCQGIVTYWNHSAEKLFDIRSNEIVGKHLGDFIPDDLPLKVISSTEPYHNIVTELKNGSFVIRNAVPVYISNGDIIGAVCTSVNITYCRNLIKELDRVQLKLNKLEKMIDKNDCQNDEKFYTVNPATMKVLQQAARVASSNATVLITGESGTGKELMAKFIYKNSSRHDKPFIEINCGAIPEALFESEMFGYDPGAFTGASKNGKPGKFELAKAGTLFLDEIGELPHEMQAKFLRVLQEKNFYRVGGKNPLVSDVRIVAATNRDMKKLVDENGFRKDLYYRLSVVILEIPPLRERKDDIPGLVDLFIRQLNYQYGRTIDGVAPEVINLLCNYSWPGNVRQLHNVIERIFILSEDNYVTIDTLNDSGVDISLLTGKPFVKNLLANTEPDDASVNGIRLDDLIDSREREVILEALKSCDYNKSQAAQLLGIPRSTLYYKIKALDIDTDFVTKKLTFC